MAIAHAAIQVTPMATATAAASLARAASPLPSRLPTRTLAAMPNAIGPVMNVSAHTFIIAMCASSATWLSCEAKTTVTSNEDASAATITAPRQPSLVISATMRASTPARASEHAAAKEDAPEPARRRAGVFRAASPVAATSGDAGAASKLRLSVRAFLRASFFAPSGSSIASYSEGVLRTYSASSARFTNLDVVVASALPRVPSPHVVTKNAFAQALSANVIRLVAATGTTTFAPAGTSGAPG